MDTKTHINFNLGSTCGLHGIVTQTMYQAALDRGLLELASHDIRSETTLEDLTKAIPVTAETKVRTYMPVDESERSKWSARLFDMGNMLIFLGFNNIYNWEIMGVAKSRSKLDKVMKAIQKALPAMKSEDPNVVPVNFWSQAPSGVVCRTRRIFVPSWDDVNINYAGKTREGLETLMGLWPPIEDNGRLLLWHGVPGTGKSYGIRSLAQAWQKWCEIHYIVDPEKFFGDADYMLQVILQSADTGDASLVPATESGAADPKAAYTGHPWSLLIMEDSDEFLTSDAKDRSGQSMSRLLNLTSGFIGQGLNVLVLITTNEPLEHIHNALQREGRCMANVQFGKLDATEAQEWAASNGVEAIDAAGENTIADLYAMTRQQRQLRTGSVEKPMGLVRA